MIHDAFDAYRTIVVDVHAHVYRSFAKHLEFIVVFIVLSAVVHVTVQMYCMSEISVPFEYGVMKQDELRFPVIQHVIILDPFEITRVELRLVHEFVVITPYQILSAV